MNDIYTSENPARGQEGRAICDKSSSSRLLLRTFLIAFILVSGGLITSGAVELFFRRSKLTTPARVSIDAVSLSRRLLRCRTS